MKEGGGGMMKNTGKAAIFILCLLTGFFLWGETVRAGEEGDSEQDFSYIDSWLASCDMGSINEGMDRLFPGFKLDGTELLKMVMEGRSGEAFRQLLAQIGDSLTGELGGIRQILIYILVLGVVSALFAEFSDLFAGEQIAQAGFYFLYLFLMVVLTKVFLFVSEVASGAVENIVLFIQLFIPTYTIAVGAAQGTAAAAYYYQLMLLLAYLVESFLNKVLIPLIYSYVMLALLNGLWSEEKLSLLLDFIAKGVGFALKVSLGTVTGLSFVQAVIVPVASGLRISAMRKAISAIPGIGGVAEGMTELMLGSAVLIKNSMGVLLLVLIAGACILPLLKILVVTGVVKLGAAVTGIVSDKRISACTDRVGEGCFLLLRCVFTAVALFVIVIAVISYTAA
jgi:Stage III sporulation protein AE (spore_III_AE).